MQGGGGLNPFGDMGALMENVKKVRQPMLRTCVPRSHVARPDGVPTSERSGSGRAMLLVIDIGLLDIGLLDTKAT